MPSALLVHRLKRFVDGERKITFLFVLASCWRCTTRRGCAQIIVYAHRQKHTHTHTQTHRHTHTTHPPHAQTHIHTWTYFLVFFAWCWRCKTRRGCAQIIGSRLRLTSGVSPRLRQLKYVRRVRGDTRNENSDTRNANSTHEWTRVCGHLFICVTCLAGMCDTTHSCHDSFICVPKLIHLCERCLQDIISHAHPSTYNKLANRFRDCCWEWDKARTHTQGRGKKREREKKEEGGGEGEEEGEGEGEGERRRERQGGERVHKI